LGFCCRSSFLHTQSTLIFKHARALTGSCCIPSVLVFITLHAAELNIGYCFLSESGPSQGTYAGLTE
jgi:hypothetical protein